MPSKVRRAEPWTGSAECYGSVASIRRITSLYPPYNSSLVGGLGLQERKAKSKSHSFLVRRPTRRSRGRGVTRWALLVRGSIAVLLTMQDSHVSVCFSTLFLLHLSF